LFNSAAAFQRLKGTDVTTLRTSLAAFGAAITLATLAVPAAASLVYLGDSAPVAGGTSGSILSLQSPASSSTATGSVGIGGRTGDAVAGANTPFPLTTLGTYGISNAFNLALWLDAAEPGNDDSITLNSLTLNVFGPAGNDALLFTASLSPVPIVLDVTPGSGNNRVNVFGLDFAQASQLQAVFSTNNRVGLAASLSEATGGPDRFVLSSRVDAGLPPAEIPVPGALWLVISGLAAFGTIARRRFGIA
jgi:hypothetical protein